MRLPQKAILPQMMRLKKYIASRSPDTSIRHEGLSRLARPPVGAVPHLLNELRKRYRDASAAIDLDIKYLVGERMPVAPSHGP